MIIIVKQLGATSYALRSIPEIGGGFLAEEVRTGRILAMQGGFDVIGSDFNRATQAQRQPGSAFKPIVYEAALENGMSPASIIMDAPFCVSQGAGPAAEMLRQFRPPLCGREDDALGRRAVAQPDDGARRVADRAWRRSPTMRSKLGVGDYPNYLSISLGAGDTTVAKLVNAYAILANQGRAVKPTMIDYVQDRTGKVIYRTDNRCQVMGNCNAPDWDGKAHAAAAVARPTAARPDGRVPDGPHPRRRGRARHRDRSARSRPADVRQDRHDVGTDQRLVRRRHAGRRCRRLPGLRPAAAAWAAMPRADASRRRSSRISRRSPSRTCPRCRSSRRRAFAGSASTARAASRVFGAFPVQEDPKSAVIWEAFQPQTEPRRFRRSTLARRAGPAGRRRRQIRIQPRVAQVQRRPRVVRARQPQQAQPEADGLQNQGAIY